MSQYQFKVNDQIIKHPENWESLVLGYNFDGKKAGAKELAQILFCDPETKALFLAQIEAVPCFEYVLSICFRCKSSDPFEEIFFTTLRLKDLSYFCNGCEMQMPSKRNSIASYLDEIAGDEKCVNTQTELELFQVQSGGRYYTRDREVVVANFISLLDLVNLFAQDAGGASFTDLTGLVHNESAIYQPAKAIITPTAVPTQDTVLTIVGEFGQTYNITIETGSFATIEEYLERICQALCCVPDGDNINMGSLEFHNRIAYCEVVNGSLCINAYWDFESVNLTVGGAVPAWFTENIQPQQRSSQDIYISPAGLFGDEVCMSWEDLKTLICKIQGGYIRESYNNEQFEFKDYCSIVEDLPDTSPANIVIDNANNVQKSFNSEWFVNKVEAGYDFRVKDFNTDSLDENWVWWGVELEGPVFNFPDNCITFTETCHGRIFGNMVFENTSNSSESVVVNVYVDTGSGKQLIDSTTEIIPPNSEVEVVLGDGFPNNSFTQYFPGNRICVDWRNESDGSTTTGANVTATDDAFWVFLCTPCFDEPFLNEDDIYVISEYGRLSDFAGCKGVKTCTVDEKFYAGLGFAISQRVQGLQDYEDTHFITYCNPDGTARQFPKCFYFQDTYTEVCDVYKGQFVSYSYYNAPLQLPNLLKDMLCQIPSMVSIPTYEWTINVGPTGIITKSKNLVFVELEGTGGKCKISFDTCANEYDLIRALQYGAVNIDLCGIEGTAIIENFDMTLGNDRRGRYRVCI